MQLLLRSMGASLAMQSSGKGSDLEVITALMSNDPNALRRAFADQIELADGQMAALTGKDGKSTLITERNAKAFKVLEREIANGKKKLGIFYGAGHRIGDVVRVHDYHAIHVASGSPDRLNQCSIRSQEPLFVGIQDSHK